MTTDSHDSDCATHNAPAYPSGPCDCATGIADDIRSALNRRSRENVSNTPDFLLAEYMLACLSAYEVATMARDQFYAINPRPGARSADALSSI